MDLREKISQLPLTSGVYLMKDAKGKVIYVGKAVSLKKRVQSYFRKLKSPLSKTDLLVSQIKSIDYIKTASEAEALILEASLIKTYKPKFNIELRDDKSYPFIMITDEAFPLIEVVRPTTKKGNKEGLKHIEAKYYGPYVNAKLIREALTIIRRIFPFRICNLLPKKACLDLHIGLCEAPCAGSVCAKEYERSIKNVRLILEGKKDELYNHLRKDMGNFVKDKNFEGAAKVRDQIRAIGALYSGTSDINYFKEAEQLKRALNLPKLPERIEAFDISNLMGHEAVGSEISFFNGKPDKNNYRRFRIREVEGIDDFKMIAEIVRRRYRRLKNEGALFPDLIIIDGGKGQLAAAQKELNELGVSIPVISIAKRQEEIFLPRRLTPIILPSDSLGLKLIQRIRDEAHRFAISYHQKLHGRNIFAADKN